MMKHLSETDSLLLVACMSSYLGRIVYFCVNVRA